MVKKLCFVVFGWTASLSYAQDNADFCHQLSALNQRIQQYHYNPKPINDSLSKNVFNLFLERLDENKRFFHKSDMALFESDKFQLDDAITQENCDFIEKYSVRLQQRIENSKTYIASLRDSIFDYS